MVARRAAVPLPPPPPPLLLLLLLVVFSCACRAQPELEFDATRVIDNVTDATSVFAADIDSDLDLDVVVALFSGAVVWYENTDGEGRFSEARTITTLAAGARAVFVADVDGDGDADVVCAAALDNTTAWHENLDGLGTFGERRVIFASDPGVTAVFVADCDNDGSPDVVTGSLGANGGVAWYANNGTGGFGERQTISGPDVGPVSVFVADLDGDGWNDVVYAAKFVDEVVWHANSGVAGGGGGGGSSGRGRFGAAQVITAAADGATSVFVADVTGDGHFDVVAASGGASRVDLFEGDGAGGFGEARLVAFVDNPESLAVADFDGDGDLDICVSARFGEPVTVYRNAGFGDYTTTAERLVVAPESAGPVASVFACALTTSGRLDVVFAGADGLVWARQLPAAHVLPAGALLVSGGGAVAVDVDNDGDQDVLMSTGSGLAWFENDGSGSFGAQRDISTTLTGAVAVAALVDDDDFADVVACSLNLARVVWFRNDGTGGFGEAIVISTATLLPADVVAADVDGDGCVDVVYASSASADSQVTWQRGNCSGGFGEPLVVNDALGDGAVSVRVAHLNEDNVLDVLYASPTQVLWQRGNGSGGFGPPEVVTTLVDGAEAVAAADLTGNGVNDILSVSFLDDTVAWYRNNGSGHFGEQNVISTSLLRPVSVFAFDFGNDGSNDVLVSSTNTNEVSLFVNVNGTGTFERRVVTRAIGGRTAVTMDASGDGEPDVLVALPPRWYPMKRDELPLADAVAVAVRAAEDFGDDSDCTASSTASRPCATLGVAAGLIAALPAVPANTIITLGAGRLPVGLAPVVLAPPSPLSGLLTVQVDAAGAELVCPGAELRTSCLTVVSGVALVGGALTVTGGRTTGDGGCVTLRATLAPPATPIAAALPLADATRFPVQSDALDAFVLRGSLFRVLLGSARSGLAARLYPGAARVPVRPVESSLTLRGCHAGRRGGGLLLSDTSGALGAALELGRLTVEESSADENGGGVSFARLFGTTVLARPVLVRNCTASGSGGGAHVNAQQPLVVDAAGGGSLALDKNAAAECGADLALEGARADADDLSAIADLGLVLSDGGASPGVCATRGARVLLPECGGPGDVPLRAESRFGASVVVPASCPPDSVQCTGGEAFWSNRTRVCSSCTRGRAPSAPGSVVCEQCEAGRFAGADGLTACQACPPGRVAEEDGASRCVPCPRGEFANSTGLARCLACPEGRYQPDANSTACLGCGAGSFSDGTGAVRCVQCPPGRASASTNGSTACEPCERHTFASVEGRSACEPCDASEFRFANRTGAQLCDLCDRDEYLSFADRDDYSTFRGCLPCPAAASCASGQPLALASAWVSPLDAATGEYRTLDCLPGRCLSARECSGGGAAEGDVSCCAAGRRLPAAENPMCGACEAGKEEWAGECVPCTSADTGLVLGYLALGVALLLVLQQATANSSGAALSKVAIGFAQAAFAFFADEGDDSPVGGGAALSFDPLGLESSCVAPMSDLTRAALPLVQLLLVCVLFVAVGALNASWWLARGRRRRFRTSPFTRVLVALAVFGYFPVFRTAVNLLRCEELPGGARVLRQFPTVSCSSGGYHAWVTVSWTLAGALLVGLSSLILAYGRPRYLAYWPDGAGADKRVRKVVERRIGFLHLSYRGDSALAASWEVAVLARSSSFVAAAALGGSSDSRFALLTLVSLAALAAHLYVQPFRRAADNRLEAVALSALAVIGSLNNSGWRGTSAARALTALLYYGVLACAVLLGVYLSQGRVVAAARAVRGRLNGSSSSSSSSPSLGEPFSAAGGEGRTRAWLALFFCWHLPPPASPAPKPGAPAVQMDVHGPEISVGHDEAAVITDSGGLVWHVHRAEDGHGVPFYSCASSGATQWERPV